MSDARGKIRIESLGVYLPEKVLTMEELLASCRRRPPWDLERITGIHERRVAVGEYAVDLAVQAARRALALSRLPGRRPGRDRLHQHLQAQPRKRVPARAGHRRAHRPGDRRRRRPRLRRGQRLRRHADRHLCAAGADPLRSRPLRHGGQRRAQHAGGPDRRPRAAPQLRRPAGRPDPGRRRRGGDPRRLARSRLRLPAASTWSPAPGTTITAIPGLRGAGRAASW